MAAIGRRQRTRHDHGARRYAAAQDLTTFAMVNFRALADIHAHRQDAASLDDHAFDHLGSRTDETAVFDDGRIGLQRLQHPTDADAAGQVDIRPDLRAGANRCPGVDHGPGPDPGADVHVAGHQHRVTADKSATTDRCRRHHAGAGFTDSVIAAGPAQWQLVEEARVRGFDHFVLVDPERQQNRFLQPLVHTPLTRLPKRFGHTEAAAFQAVQALLDGLAELGRRAPRRQIPALLPGSLDQILQMSLVLVGHASSYPSSKCS